MLHITLSDKAPANDPGDPLDRTHYGWGEHDTIAENWKNNRGYWVLGARAHREKYVLFSWVGSHEIVMVARINDIVDAPGRPGRKIIVGEPLPENDPVWQAYVGHPTPDSARVRNPVTYPDLTDVGWPCACGCGTEIYSGEFVRGHEQTALHQRVAQIGTITEFLRWFDTTIAGGKAEAPAGYTFSGDGKLDLTVSPDGGINLRYAPAASV